MGITIIGMFHLQKTIDSDDMFNKTMKGFTTCLQTQSILPQLKTLNY